MLYVNDVGKRSSSASNTRKLEPLANKRHRGVGVADWAEIHHRRAEFGAYEEDFHLEAATNHATSAPDHTYRFLNAFYFNYI